MNKKAISPVVATILMVLITIAAVTIIWAAIIPMVRDKITTGTACLDVSTDLIIDKDYTCIKSDNNISVKVGRGTNEYDLVKFQFIIQDANGNTKTEEEDASSIGVNEAKVFTLNESDYSTYIKLQVAPIITDGNAEQTCDIAAIIDLKAC